MAKVWNNVIVRGLRGMFGDQVLIKIDKAGRTIVGNKPVFARGRVFTPAQRAQQERFRAARAYAQESKHLAVYQAKAAGIPLTPSNVAMIDWFQPPQIQAVDLSNWTGQAGQVIRIQAVDDVMIQRVWVTIFDEAGEIRERGEGQRGEGDWWTYQTSVPAGGSAKVRVSAEDLPGHITETELGLE